MRASRLEIKEIIDWINHDPFKEALLITEAPIKRSTLMQMLSGTYIPSERMINALKRVKSKFPEGVPITKTLGFKAAG